MNKDHFVGNLILRAIESNNLELMKVVLEKSPRIKKEDFLTIAMTQNRLDLFEFGLSIIELQDPKNIFVSCLSRDKLEFFNLLISKGYDFDAKKLKLQDIDQISASQSLRVLEVLLEHGMELKDFEALALINFSIQVIKEKLILLLSDMLKDKQKLRDL